MSKKLIVFTSPNWDEFEKHWEWLQESQKNFSNDAGSVSAFNGKKYYCQGGKGWDFNKIKETLDEIKATELAVLIHDTYDMTKSEIESILMKRNDCQKRLVCGYSSSGEQEPFKSFIKPLCQGGQLAHDHFDRFWNFIWTNDGYSKAIEYRSKTMLPFLALHLLLTAKSDSQLPENIKKEFIKEINSASEWSQKYFDTLGLSSGEFEQELETLQEATIQKDNSGKDDLKNNPDLKELSSMIESLLKRLNTALAKYMNEMM